MQKGIRMNWKERIYRCMELIGRLWRTRYLSCTIINTIPSSLTTHLALSPPPYQRWNAHPQTVHYPLRGFISLIVTSPKSWTLTHKACLHVEQSGLKRSVLVTIFHRCITLYTRNVCTQ